MAVSIHMIPLRGSLDFCSVESIILVVVVSDSKITPVHVKKKLQTAPESYRKVRHTRTRRRTCIWVLALPVISPHICTESYVWIQLL